ncbi:MAG: lipoyl(octanoyl) transferase LipB [Alphaproteobacteria bacterium]|nr:lipoyl(octanoyl) transferase LipB [Alphaproteobacteria bacterium]
MLVVEDLGRADYAISWARQKALLAARIAREVPDTLLLVEHEPVYTLGRRRGAAANVLAPQGVPVLQVERGGDVTWHGPGQITAYPIVALPEGRQDLHRHLHDLEEAAIRTCADFGLSAGRDDRNTGAWVAGRKVCSVGIACRRWVTWHGLALNVAPDMDFFTRINPCGMEVGVMTSMATELGHAPDFEAVKRALVGHLRDLLPHGPPPDDRTG